MAKKKSITQRQLENLDWLESVGTEDYEKVQAKDLDGILLSYANDFKDNLLVNIKKKNVTASGNLEKEIYINTYEKGTTKILDISLVYYAKFVDKGVKGKLDDSNAPNSPYQFKNFGISEDGRKSLKNYIKSARKKVSSADVQKYKKTKTEKKFQKIADTELNKLIYLIKAYGIKTTNIVTDATNKSFKGIETDIAESIGFNIAANLTK